MIDKQGADRPRAAATIGVFDGVHRGHQDVLARVVAAAQSINGAAVAVTFARHPLAILDPQACPVPLSTVEERRAAIAAQGIDDVIVLDFDAAMSRLSAREFLQTALLRRYDLKVLVVGPDFAMGKDRAGDVQALHRLGDEIGFALQVAGPVIDPDGSAVSSTRLRQALAQGEVDRVRELCGREYVLTGRVVGGHGRGRELGFPTANLDVDGPKMLPGDGVYAALARVGEGVHADATWRPAVINVGLAPTFGEGERRVEIHLLDAEEDLRGERLAVRFVARLRGEVRFADVAALKAQIAADVATARALVGAFSAHSPAG
jgi:riboflavin kinase/FMN adenylyltransferase